MSNTLQDIINRLQKTCALLTQIDRSIESDVKSEQVVSQAEEAALRQKTETLAASEKKVQAFLNIAKAHTRASHNA